MNRLPTMPWRLGIQPVVTADWFTLVSVGKVEWLFR